MNSQPRASDPSALKHEWSLVSDHCIHCHVPRYAVEDNLVSVDCGPRTDKEKAPMKAP